MEGIIGNVFVVGIDGSEGSHNAFELVTKDLHRTGLDKTIIVHIFNSKKEHELGVQYHSKTIYNRYADELKNALKQDDYEIVFEDRKENENVFEQINHIAESKNPTLLVVGFRGYKGTMNRPDELSKSINYLVHKPTIPVLVVKEKTSRVSRIDGKFKWLLALESAESKSFKAMKSMLRYVDAENDHVYGLTVDISMKDVEGQNDEKNGVKKAFETEMTNFQIKNSEFNIIHKQEKTENIHDLIIKWINEHVSQENHFIDFVVLGYNPQKYSFDKAADNSTVDVLKRTSVNVYFDH
jgi:nucleotide-binding universal stress UspA family protein